MRLSSDTLVVQLETGEAYVDACGTDIMHCTARFVNAFISVPPLRQHIPAGSVDMRITGVDGTAACQY